VRRKQCSHQTRLVSQLAVDMNVTTTVFVVVCYCPDVTNSRKILKNQMLTLHINKLQKKTTVYLLSNMFQL
jgi:hypothetical protein